MRKLDLVLVAAGLLAAGCAQEKRTSLCHEFYDLSEYEQAKVGDVLEVAEVVPLRFEGAKYLSLVNFIDDYVLLEELEDKVHVFERDGRYVGCSSKAKGQGPGEFARMIGHVVNPYTHSIDLLTISRLMSFDAGFDSCRHEMEIPTIVGSADKCLYDDGIALNDSIYLLHTSIVTAPYKVIRYNAASGETLGTWFYADDVRALFHVGQKKFSRMPDGTVLMVAEAYTPYIYGYDSEGDSLYRAIEFRYPERTITDHVTLADFRKDNHIAKKYMTGDCELPLQQMVNSKYVVTQMRTNEDYLKDRYYLVTDRRSGKNRRIDAVEDGDVKLLNLKAMDEEGVYVVCRKGELDENPGSLLGFTPSAGLFAGLDDDDVILVKYVFRE